MKAYFLLKQATSNREIEEAKSILGQLWSKAFKESNWPYKS